MSSHFEWQVGDDDGHWETIAQETGRRRRRAMRYVWIALLVAILGAAAGGYLVVRRSYIASNERMAFEI